MPPTHLVDWLLGAKTPSIRYQTARDLLCLPDSSPEMRLAQQAIMNDGVVPAILAKQTTSGQWANEHSYYTPKYVSTHWNLVLLSELHVDCIDMRFQRGVQYMLNATVRDNLQIACFRGNLLRYALQAGRADDPRVEAIVDAVVKDITGGYCQCQHNGGFSCAWGVVRALWGLAALKEMRQRADVQAAIEQGLHFLLDTFSLTEANYPTPDNGKVHPMWFKLNFPLFYQVDILFSLRVLADLNALDHPKATAALDWLEAQRLPNGRWHGSSPFRQRTWHELGDSAETARWVSLQAAVILQRAKRYESKVLAKVTA
ncbi:MAG: hypothetical protein GC179_29735 [Anaerolineaceae bacterium]|nr:hypothetical protein [Anaerolineaceae bacterium]